MEKSSNESVSTIEDAKLMEKVKYNSQKGSFGFLTPIVWGNVILMTVLHCMALVGVVLGPFMKWQSMVFFMFYYLFSGLGVTAGAHRLWAHKSYKAKLPLQIALMFFNCISMQNDILTWSRDHRVHHKYTETHADPHNALRGFFFAHVGWLLMRKHPDVFVKAKTLPASVHLDDDNHPSRGTLVLLGRKSLVRLICGEAGPTTNS
ncbi:hypothetical protein EMCRGX_G029825 [Ephydatia muelleri]